MPMVAWREEVQGLWSQTELYRFVEGNNLCPSTKYWRPWLFVIFKKLLSRSKLLQYDRRQKLCGVFCSKIFTLHLEGLQDRGK